jgi:predicted nucleic acid-binding protein
MSKSNAYCWDTSVFLAWINQEENAPLGDIDIVLNKVYSKEISLIVSVTTYTEILRAKHTREQLETFDRFLSRSNVFRADATFPIAQKAEEIRSRALAENRKIKTPDATIISTAICYSAAALFTLEPSHHNLSGRSIVDGLIISLPCDPNGQRALPFNFEVQPCPADLPQTIKIQQKRRPRIQ